MDDPNYSGNSESPAGGGESHDVASRHHSASMARRRRERIQDHRRDGLANTNAMAAGLSCVTADLMAVEMLIAGAIRKDLAGRAINTEELDARSSSLNLLVRYAKQITQLSQLERQLGNADGKASRPKNERPSEEN